MKITCFADEISPLFSDQLRVMEDLGIRWMDLRSCWDTPVLQLKTQQLKDIRAMAEDKGIGISPENQQHIFERFYRVDKSRSKATGGTGLGLAIVKHIAAMHHARIAIESELGRGTTISVFFERCNEA